MRKVAIVLVAAVSLSTFSGCGGPYHLRNSANDWYNQKYGESPWLFGNVVSNYIYLFVAGFLGLVDTVVLNTYYFWFEDAQPFGDGKGTVHEFKQPTSGKKMK
ncbi:MAG TPA: hypothetical protein VFC90_07875 [Planctomycetota bacterium]|nr:hypothetical protein [Planctomycetota bacterium]